MMTAYDEVFLAIVLVIVFIIAGIALKWIKKADLLRVLCLDYLSQIWRLRGKHGTLDELEAEIDADLHEMGERK